MQHKKNTRENINSLWYLVQLYGVTTDGVFFSGLFKKELLVDLNIEGGIIKLEKVSLARSKSFYRTNSLSLGDLVVKIIYILKMKWSGS